MKDKIKNLLQDFAEKNLVGIICIVIIILICNAFKPSSLVTYQDRKYINHLEKCAPYQTEGKIKLVGLQSSISIIKGVQNGKCVIQTINKFTNKSALATMCSLNNPQLKELTEARAKHSYGIWEYNDGKIIKRFIKEGACSSYTLKDNKWVKTK